MPLKPPPEQPKNQQRPKVPNPKYTGIKPDNSKDKQQHLKSSALLIQRCGRGALLRCTKSYPCRVNVTDQNREERIQRYASAKADVFAAEDIFWKALREPWLPSMDEKVNNGTKLQEELGDIRGAQMARAEQAETTSSVTTPDCQGECTNNLVDNVRKEVTDLKAKLSATTEDCVRFRRIAELERRRADEAEVKLQKLTKHPLQVIKDWIDHLIISQKAMTASTDLKLERLRLFIQVEVPRVEVCPTISGSILAPTDPNLLRPGVSTLKPIPALYDNPSTLHPADAKALTTLQANATEVMLHPEEINGLREMVSRRLRLSLMVQELEAHVQFLGEANKEVLNSHGDPKARLELQESFCSGNSQKVSKGDQRLHGSGSGGSL